jgi:DNA-directed RNA polymerase sigma subunit (sigma70/sigma32)
MTTRRAVAKTQEEQERKGASKLLDKMLKSRKINIESILAPEDLTTLKVMIRKLPTKEKGVLKARFGIGDGILRTQKEAARSLSVTITSIKETENSAIKRLRQSSYAEEITRKLRRRIIDSIYKHGLGGAKTPT